MVGEEPVIIAVVWRQAQPAVQGRRTTADVAPTDGERVHEPVTGPVTTAVAEPAIADESATVTGANVEKSAGTDTAEAPPAETVSQVALEPGVAAKRAPTVPPRHEPIQPPVEPAATITEGLV